ncbi:MAG TPA: S41 family peptidase [Longimicrobiales bacterium]
MPAGHLTERPCTLRRGVWCALVLALACLPSACALHRHRPESGTSVQVTIGAEPTVAEPSPPPRPVVAAPRPDTGAHGLAPAAGPLLAEELRARTFDVAWRRVRDGFFDPAFNGLSWDSIGAVFRPQALAAERSGPFHDVLARMLATLGVSHTVVLSPERLAAESARESGWTGAEVRRLKDGWVVYRVAPGSPAAKAGLHAGDVVDSISGHAADDIARAGDRAWLRPNESLRARTAAVNEWLAGNRGLVVRVVARDTLDHERALEMKAARYPGPSVRIGNLPPARATLEVRRLEGGWGYLRFSSFVPALRPRIEDAIRGMGDAPGLIIDLRGNPGGYDALGDRIAALLMSEPRVLTETRTRHGSRTDRERPAEHGFHGPVVVLLDALSASASEQFAAPMQELKRVVVVGERSAGADLEATVVTLPTGGALMYPAGQPRTPAGRVIEGDGVTPDVEAHLSRRELARGHDEQLDAAVAALEKLAPRGTSPGHWRRWHGIPIPKP